MAANASIEMENSLNKEHGNGSMIECLGRRKGICCRRVLFEPFHLSDAECLTLANRGRTVLRTPPRSLLLSRRTKTLVSFYNMQRITSILLHLRHSCTAQSICNEPFCVPAR